MRIDPVFTYINRRFLVGTPHVCVSPHWVFTRSKGWILSCFCVLTGIFLRTFAIMRQLILKIIDHIFVFNDIMIIVTIVKNHSGIPL